MSRDLVALGRGAQMLQTATIRIKGEHIVTRSQSDSQLQTHFLRKIKGAILVALSDLTEGGAPVREHNAASLHQC